VLPILATPSFLLCLRHFCSCGHLAHDTYPRWYWYSDDFWVGSFSAAAILGVCSNLKGRFWFAFWFVGLILNRLVWNNGFGMIFDILGFPTVLWLATRGLLKRPCIKQP
jgi:hypothetical protein